MGHINGWQTNGRTEISFSSGYVSNIEHTNQESAQGPELRGYKTVCAKLGLSMCVYFICRMLAGFSSFYLNALTGFLPQWLYSILIYTNTILLTYLVPIVFTVVLFRYNASVRELYKKPRRIARALGTFPAAYGLGYGVALLTLLASYILSRTVGGNTGIEELLRPTTIEPASDMLEVILLMVLLIIAAPLFEEYWVRGVIFDVLKPYGTGLAIIISSLIFGFMHGSLYMFFYTTVLGFALAYIRYATGSLFIVTIIHALVNAISGILLLLASLSDMADSQNMYINTLEMIFSVIVLVLIIVGIVAFFARIPKIKKYRFENPWTEIGPWKKVGLFFISIPVIFMISLYINELSGFMLLRLLF